MREGLETGCVVDVAVDFGTGAVAVLLMKAGIPRDWLVRWGHSNAAAQRRDSQDCRRGWNRQRFAVVAIEAGRSGDCMIGFAVVDCAAVRTLGSVDAAEVAAAAETAAVQSVDAVVRFVDAVDAVGREEAAAIAIRTAGAVEGKLGMAVVAAVVEEGVKTLDMPVEAVVVAEEEGQEEEAGNTARLELGSSRN